MTEQIPSDLTKVLPEDIEERFGLCGPVREEPPQPGLGQCYVTKQWLPAGQLEDLYGQRISARGKAILQAYLSRHGALREEYETPSFWRRFGCYFLDMQAIQWGTVLLLACWGILLHRRLVSERAHFQWRNVTILLMLVEIPIIYFALMQGLTGRTAGKIVGRLRVVRVDGAAIGILRATLRSVLLNLGGVLLVAGVVVANVTDMPWLLTCAGWLALGWSLCDGLVLLGDTRLQRSLHDRICRTRVIQEN